MKARGWVTHALVLAVNVLASGTAAASPEEASPRVLEQGPPVHATVRYRSGAHWHAMEIWRHGARVRRDTDGLVTVMLERNSGEVVVIDHEHRQVLRGSRDAVAAKGLVLSWDDVAHLLPATAETWRRGEERTVEGHRCRVFAASSRSLCWSTDLGLPMWIKDARGEIMASVSTAEAHVDDGAFVVAAPGYAQPALSREH